MLTPTYINPWEDALPIPKEWAILAGLAAIRPLPADRKFSEWDDVETQRKVAEHYRNGGGHHMVAYGPTDFYILPSPSGHHIIGYRWGNEGDEYGTVFTEGRDIGPLLDTILRLAQALKN